jgi:hypothetical protein
VPSQSQVHAGAGDRNSSQDGVSHHRRLPPSQSRSSTNPLYKKKTMFGFKEIKDYVVLQKPQEQGDRLPPPRT